jgi:hypothetical protein
LCCSGHERVEATVQAAARLGRGRHGCAGPALFCKYRHSSLLPSLLWRSQRFAVSGCLQGVRKEAAMLCCNESVD